MIGSVESLASPGHGSVKFSQSLDLAAGDVWSALDRASSGGRRPFHHHAMKRILEINVEETLTTEPDADRKDMGRKEMVQRDKIINALSEPMFDLQGAVLR